MVTLKVIDTGFVQSPSKYFPKGTRLSKMFSVGSLPDGNVKKKSNRFENRYFWQLEVIRTNGNWDDGAVGVKIQMSEQHSGIFFVVVGKHKSITLAVRHRDHYVNWLAPPPYCSLQSQNRFIFSCDGSSLVFIALFWPIWRREGTAYKRTRHSQGVSGRYAG